jgi:hypothetical protein
LKDFDVGEGILSVLFGGFFILIALTIILGLAGLERTVIFRVWIALAVVWAPYLFVRFGRNSN